MNKKICIAILGLIMFAAIIGITKAQIDASIEVKDSGDNSISGGTVLPGTVAYVYGTYVDLDGNAPASALMVVRYDDGSGWDVPVTLFDGTVNDGQTIVRTYTMTEYGNYQFIWRCEAPSGVSEKCGEVAIDYGLTFVIPEPGTIAGLIMALSAFGLLAVKRIRTK